MKISLTEKQVRMLVPFADRVYAASQLGKPGMLVAQIRWNKDRRWWMEPGFLDHEHAKLITEKGEACGCNHCEKTKYCYLRQGHAGECEVLACAETDDP